MSVEQWVRVRAADGTLRIESNVPFPTAVAMLESAKTKLIMDALSPVAPSASGASTSPAAGAARVPAFVVGKVA